MYTNPCTGPLQRTLMGIIEMFLTSSNIGVCQEGALKRTRTGFNLPDHRPDCLCIGYQGGNAFYVLRLWVYVDGEDD